MSSVAGEYGYTQLKAEQKSVIVSFVKGKYASLQDSAKEFVICCFHVSHKVSREKDIFMAFSAFHRRRS